MKTIKLFFLLALLLYALIFVTSSCRSTRSTIDPRVRKAYRQQYGISPTYDNSRRFNHRTESPYCPIW